MADTKTTGNKLPSIVLDCGEDTEVSLSRCIEEGETMLDRISDLIDNSSRAVESSHRILRKISPKVLL